MIVEFSRSSQPCKASSLRQSSIQSSAEIQINGCFPQSANCYVDTYGRDVSFRDLQPQVDFMGINNAPPTPATGASNRGVSSAMMFSENISYSQIASAWTQPEFSTSVMQQQERPLVINQTVGTYSLENIPSGKLYPKCAQGVGNYSSHLLPDVVSSPANSISLKEKVPEDRASGGIHLNRTPQQKPQKRKKHRPKVVVEGKPRLHWRMKKMSLKLLLQYLHQDPVEESLTSVQNRKKRNSWILVKVPNWNNILIVLN